MSEPGRRHGFLSSLDLKKIAVVLMTVDHTGAFVDGMPIVLRMVGRLSAPLFFFCLVEGFFHTRSHAAYLKRLGAGAVFMALGNFILRPHSGLVEVLHPNIFFSMFLCYVFMLLLKNIPSPGLSLFDRVGLVLLAVAVYTLVFMAEYHLYLFAMVLPFYFFRGRRVSLAVYAGACLIAWFVTLPSGFGLYRFADDYQWLMAFSAVILFFYNGAPGRKSPLAKNFFYFYYPLHIWALTLLNNLLLGR